VSETVRTLWFEDVGFLHEPILDTPFGRYSVRQMVIILVFAFLSYVASLFFSDLLMKIVAAGSIFTFGAAAFAMRRIKTISPERHILLLLGVGRVKPRRAAAAEGKAVKKAGAPPVKSVVVSTTLESPVKIVGVLRDPVHKKYLPEKNFDVYIDGRFHYSGVTDEQGFFTVFFVPDRYGPFSIIVKPEGLAEALNITVNVKPKEGAEIA